MTRAQILEKVLLKAIDGGYDPDEVIRFWIAEGCKKDYTDGFGGHSFVGDSFEHWIDENGVEILGSIDLYTVIFSHEFAQCFWGETLLKTRDGRHIKVYTTRKSRENFELRLKGEMPKWRFHLIQMALTEDPIVYLKKFIKNER